MTAYDHYQQFCVGRHGKEKIYKTIQRFIFVPVFIIYNIILDYIEN